MAHDTDLNSKWTAARTAIEDDNLPMLRELMGALEKELAADPLFQRLANNLLLSATTFVSPDCLVCLVEEFGCDIHHSSASLSRGALALAIHWSDPHIRARAFNAMMASAKKEMLDAQESGWTAALKTALFVGDVEIMRSLASFIGGERFSEWVPKIRSGSADAWALAARNGKLEMIDILMAIPEMSARFDMGMAFGGHSLAYAADEFRHTSFAREIRAIAVSRHEQGLIEDACHPPRPATQAAMASRRM